MIDWTDATALIKSDRAVRGKNSLAALELLAHLRADGRAARAIKLAADETPVPGQGAEARGMQIKALVGARLLTRHEGMGVRIPFKGGIHSSEPVLPACEVSVADVARIAALTSKDERGAAMGLLAAARWRYGTGERFSFDPVRVVGGWRGTSGHEGIDALRALEVLDFIRRDGNMLVIPQTDRVTGMNALRRIAERVSGGQTAVGP